MCYWQRVSLLHWNSQNWKKVLKLCQKSLLYFTASVLRFTETQLREELETFQQIKEVHITEALGLIQNGLRLIYLQCNIYFVFTSRTIVHWCPRVVTKCDQPWHHHERPHAPGLETRCRDSRHWNSKDALCRIYQRCWVPLCLDKERKNSVKCSVQGR